MACVYAQRDQTATAKPAVATTTLESLFATRKGQHRQAGGGDLLITDVAHGDPREDLRISWMHIRTCLIFRRNYHCKHPRRHWATMLMAMLLVTTTWHRILTACKAATTLTTKHVTFRL